MSLSLLALVGFAFWTLCLLAAVAFVRTWVVLRQVERPSGFTAGVPHGSDGYWRLNRAHLNCTENLPIFGAIVVAGHLLDADTGLFGWLAFLVLGARLLQGIVHLVSGSDAAVLVRFTALLVQMGAQFAMVAALFA